MGPGHAVRRADYQRPGQLVNAHVGSYFPDLFHIARERGPLALYTGSKPTIARAFSVHAVLFLGVEMGMKFFDGFVWAKRILRRRMSKHTVNSSD